MTHDTWHMKCDTWHVTYRGWWTLSQNWRSLTPTAWELWCFEDWEEKDDWVTLWFNDKGVCRKQERRKTEKGEEKIMEIGRRKKHEETWSYGNILKDNERYWKIREETGRIGKKPEETGKMGVKTRNKREETGKHTKNGKKRDKTERNGKKREGTGRSGKKREDGHLCHLFHLCYLCNICNLCHIYYLYHLYIEKGGTTWASSKARVTLGSAMRCNRPQTTNKYMNIVPSRFSNQRFFIWFNLEFGTIWKVRSSLLDSVNTTFGQQTKGSFFSLNRPLVRCNLYVSCTFVFFCDSLPLAAFPGNHHS